LLFFGIYIIIITLFTILSTQLKPVRTSLLIKCNIFYTFPMDIQIEKKRRPMQSSILSSLLSLLCLFLLMSKIDIHLFGRRLIKQYEKTNTLSDREYRINNYSETDQIDYTCMYPETE